MDTEVSRLLNFAYFYLRFRPRTESEMLQYLEKKAKKFSFADDSVKKTLNKLMDQKLIDDSQFVVWFVEIRGSSKKKSVAYLKNELRVRGVSSDVVGAYFEQNIIDEDESALRALKSQWRKINREDLPAGRQGKRKRFEKAAAFLQRKGFGYSIIKRAIAEIEEKE